MKRAWSREDRKSRQEEWLKNSGFRGAKRATDSHPLAADLPNNSRPTFFEYYAIAFEWLHSEVRPLLHPDLESAHKVRADFWGLVPDSAYERQQAQELVRQYAAVVERRLAEEIGSHSIGYWIHVYRRLFPGAITPRQSPRTTLFVRRRLEAAFQKYAMTDGGPGIAWSDEVKAEEVLSGVPKKYRPPKLIEAYISGPRQPLLTEFGVAELLQIYRCEQMAYEMWRCGAALRMISKGASLIVDHTTEDCFFDDRSEELNRLVVNYDNREPQFIASATATVFSSEGEPEAKGKILLPQYNVEKMTVGEFSGFFERLGLKFADDTQLNFHWLPIDLRGYVAAHRPLDKDFKVKHGFSFEIPLAVIMALFYLKIEMSIIEPLFLYQSYQRAYTGPSEVAGVENLIMEKIGECAERLGSPVPAREDVLRAIEFLTLTEEKRKSISLLTGGPNYLFLPSESGQVLIDFAWIVHSLQYLFYGVPLDGMSAKGSLLELLVTGGRSVLPDGECKGFDRQSREVDAAFDCGKILVIVECKANARSIAYERGDIEAFEHRMKMVEKGIRQADDKAKWFSSHPKGTNYDISRFEGILPVVITPFAEFMPSLDDRYWIAPEVPRVLMPHELKDLLTRPDIESIIRACPNTVFIPLSIAP